jgi:DNA replication licensing factor MCM2
VRSCLRLSDYDSNLGLDTYSNADLDDTTSQPELTRAQRLAAEAAMARRDRGLPTGTRASRRQRAPAFLQSDDEDYGDLPPGAGLLEGIDTRRRRRQYDERPEDDDMEGQGEDEVPLEELGDIKAPSIAEWVGIEAVRRAVQRHFKAFLMTYVDENGQSVYGQRIKHLGEGESSSPPPKNVFTLDPAA